MTQRWYRVIYRIWLISLLLWITACGGGTSDAPAPDPTPVPPSLIANISQQVSDLTVTLDARLSLGSIASYQWNFGDGSSGSGETVTHTYSAAGNYTVTLTVVGAQGESNSSSSFVQLSASEAIHFSDAALELKIRQALGEQGFDLTDTTPITADQLSHLTWLDLDYRSQTDEQQIQSLAGIEQLVNLTSLSLYGQNISNIAPIASLPLLQTLYLDKNPIQSLQGLDGLEQLKRVSLTLTPIHSLAPLLASGLSRNAGSLELGYNCLYMGENSVPQEQLQSLKSSGVVLEATYSADTYSKYAEYFENSTSCQNYLANIQPSVTANVSSDGIVYAWNFDDSAIDADAKLRCNLFYDLFQQQARVADQSVDCAAQGQVTRKMTANGHYNGKLAFTDGFGGKTVVDLPEIVFSSATAQAHIRSIDWGQVVVSHNPQLIPNRDALLRVHVVNDASADIPVPDITLTLTLNGQSQTLAMVKPSVLPAALDYENMDASYHAIIPASLMQSGLQATVTLNNGESQQLTPTFANTPAFYLTLVPMLVDGKIIASPNADEIQRALHSFWPLGAIAIKEHATFTPVATSGSDLLDELADLRTVEGDPSYFYGIYSHDIQNDFAGVGFLSTPVAIGYDSESESERCQNMGADYLCVMSHELGHNFGLDHVNCGVDNGTSDYPYDPSNMGSLGISFDLATLYKSSEYVDLMSYCSPQHVSDFSFIHAQDFLAINTPAPFPLMRASRSLVAKTSTVAAGILLSGSVAKNGDVELKRVIPLSRAAIESSPSDVKVIASSQSQGTVTRYATLLNTAEKEQTQNTQHFQVELPFTDLTSVIITRNGSELYRKTLTVAKSQKATTLPQITEQAAQVCLQWQVGDFDGVTLMHVADAGQQTVLTLQNPNPLACLSKENLPDGGHWLMVTHKGLIIASYEISR